VSLGLAGEAEPPGELDGLGLTREDLVNMLRAMLLTRGVEERGLILYKQGKVPGSFYSGRGNEAAAVGTGMALRPQDVATPTQRDMGVHIVRGLPPWRILAQYMGRVDGPMRGRDGNVHMADPALGTFPMVSHMGAMAPIAVGMALAFRIRGERRVAATWFGDGASARGDVHEAMNFAGVRRLPVVFFLDNNQWAYSTPTRLQYACERLAGRATAYGFEGVSVDGTDVIAVHREARRAIEQAREGGGPALVECVTLRMEGHGAHDDASYIPKELHDEWAKRDPIERFRERLRASAGLTGDEEAALAASVAEVLDDAVRRAEASPLPDPDTAGDGVYAEPGEADPGDNALPQPRGTDSNDGGNTK
jgi:pyruvate dehydrogenase E1 component alpha subunit